MDIDLLTTYLTRKYTGRVDYEFGKSIIYIWYGKNGNKRIQIAVDNGRLDICWYNVLYIAKTPNNPSNGRRLVTLYMADPEFLAKLHELLLKIGLKPSRLKATF